MGCPASAPADLTFTLSGMLRDEMTSMPDDVNTDELVEDFYEAHGFEEWQRLVHRAAQDAAARHVAAELEDCGGERRGRRAVDLSAWASAQNDQVDEIVSACRLEERCEDAGQDAERKRILRYFLRQMWFYSAVQEAAVAEAASVGVRTGDEVEPEVHALYWRSYDEHRARQRRQDEAVWRSARAASRGGLGSLRSRLGPAVGRGAGRAPRSARRAPSRAGPSSEGDDPPGLGPRPPAVVIRLPLESLVPSVFVEVDSPDDVPRLQSWLDTHPEIAVVLEAAKNLLPHEGEA